MQLVATTLLGRIEKEVVDIIAYYNGIAPLL